MWLLNTRSAELRYFSHPPPRYAILSHVWTQEEQSFQDVQALLARSTPQNGSPRDHASAKIRNCCIRAEEDGFEWVWIDTCCIDKTSSAELSEAINSMFQWYSSATICYAYLADVPATDRIHNPQSAFRRSAWFGRGWTLQELLAPSAVIFLSQDWQVLHHKELIPKLLEEITGIDAAVLSYAELIPDFPVVTRLGWASKRRTSRPEDEAYSLLGLFGLSMPIIYGEGRHAFRRLQEELIKRSADHSFFLWGGYLCPYPQPVGNCVLTSIDDPLLSREVRSRERGLFAESPQDYANVMPLLCLVPAIEIEDAVERVAKGHPEIPYYKRDSSFELPEFTVTGHGVRARLPILEPVQLLGPRAPGPEGHLSPAWLEHTAAIAFLPGIGREYGSDRYSCICLPLRPTNKRRTVYQVGISHVDHTLCRWRPGNHADTLFARYGSFDHLMRYVLLAPDARIHWRDIYINDTQAYDPAPHSQSLVSQLRHVSISGPAGLQVAYALRLSPTVACAQQSDDPRWWVLHPTTRRTFQFRHSRLGRVYLTLGCCEVAGTEEPLWGAIQCARSHWIPYQQMSLYHTMPPRCGLPHLVWRTEAGMPLHACIATDGTDDPARVYIVRSDAPITHPKIGRLLVTLMIEVEEAVAGSWKPVEYKY
ncbi:heterokaryon incompatibility protein-domain-containing protein [Cerioporus squamosus]|nr:heterokaryon incompatibility protein-domain-containing protein [Cerioporus squamosus]